MSSYNFDPVWKNIHSKLEKGVDRETAQEADGHGGLIPSNEKRMARAEKADLLTLPEDVSGTNCANCKFMDMKNGYCLHPKVDQPVTARMCCALWDAQGCYRAWENK